ncbi:hypothetical protein [Metabacillus sp. RGM 3146]|uniref:hypothetical protein n=1 Tax=Metabacillus sp. RGM 3146 TaxID=3401092 RepID=UPI003B9CE388
MKYINVGKERIRFDYVGSEEYEHVLCCLQCGYEFRVLLNRPSFSCSLCGNLNSIKEVSSFKVIGCIEPHRVSQTA